MKDKPVTYRKFKSATDDEINRAIKVKKAYL